MPPVAEVKTTGKPEQTGAGRKTNEKATQHVAPAGGTNTVSSQGEVEPVPVATNIPDPGAPEPTEDRPARSPRVGGTQGTAPATEPNPTAGDEKDS